MKDCYLQAPEMYVGAWREPDVDSGNREGFQLGEVASYRNPGHNYIDGLVYLRCHAIWWNQC
jgi:hypothetical protein